MLLSAVSFLVVAQSSSEVLERLMNSPVLLSVLLSSCLEDKLFNRAVVLKSCLYKIVFQACA